MMIDGASAVVIERFLPSGMARIHRLLIPLLGEVIKGRLKHGGNAIAIVDRIEREVAPILREGVGLGTHGAAEDMAVLVHHAMRDGAQGVGIEVLLEQPSIGIGRGLHRAHIGAHIHHCATERAIGALGCLEADEIERLNEECTHAEDENGNGHQQDTKAELTRETTS